MRPTLLLAAAAALPSLASAQCAVGATVSITVGTTTATTTTVAAILPRASALIGCASVDALYGGEIVLSCDAASALTADASACIAIHACTARAETFVSTDATLQLPVVCRPVF